MKIRTFGLAVLAGLALPAIAAAHPSVYTDAAKIADAGDPSVLTDQTRYVVANHGFTMVLRESNGVSAGGVLDYKVVPGAYRNRAGYTRADLIADADTAVQAHATCSGVPALADQDNIIAWQDTTVPLEPFYNYIPWQGTSAGLEDDPAAWTDDVLALTGVDLEALSTVQEFTTACTNLGGTYVPADATQSTNAAFNSGLVGHYEDEIAELQADKTALQSALAIANNAKAVAEDATTAALAGKATAERKVTELEEAKAASDARTAAALRDLEAATAQIGALRLAVAPLKLAVVRAALPMPEVTVTGPPLAPVLVRVLVSSAKAKSMGLKYRTLGRITATTGADGTVTVVPTVHRSAAAAIARATGAVAVTVDALTGDRRAAISSRLAR